MLSSNMNIETAKTLVEQLRREAKYSRSGLCKAAGLSGSYLRNFILKAKTIRRDQFEQLISFMGYEWEQFESMVATESGHKGAIKDSLTARDSINYDPIERKHAPCPLPVFDLVDADTPGAVAVQCWQNLACGSGCDLERCDDLKFLRTVPSGKGVSVVIVRGESMEPTFMPRDAIIIRDMDYTLPSLDVENGDIANVRYMIQSEINHNAYYVLCINNEPPTLKKVRFSGKDARWHMSIVPDNEAYEDHVVEKSDTIKFLAKVIGKTKQEEDRILAKESEHHPT